MRAFDELYPLHLLYRRLPAVTEQPVVINHTTGPKLPPPLYSMYRTAPAQGINLPSVKII